MIISADTIADLTTRIETLEAEADIRRIQARYMFLCDTPCPEFGITNDKDRIDAILALYTEDAVWEGVGTHYEGQFGRADGKAAISAHFQRFWGEKRDPALVLNAHYLTSEQIHVQGNRASGQWIHMQPWLFADGTALLRSSRLNNTFTRIDGHWLIARTRTENVFTAPLPDGFTENFESASTLMRSKNGLG
ncbi:nuclear transport factor 2 family protein [Williamsia phyllosphaerae]|uniref:Polyketide cyclase n=1 Tax=Williamsia phyllosphaerae TaxID=885042 RepID=A0ABQ1U8Y5_9NOCA|nr:nuclear transport factor 2 family protein [Williamsia phyllosphaerae]GGF11595.1 polyketide cyclase [Williamsia phyllosphaerae]